MVTWIIWILERIIMIGNYGYIYIYTYIYIYIHNNNGMITDWINGLQMGWIIMITINIDNGMI